MSQATPSIKALQYALILSVAAPFLLGGCGPGVAVSGGEAQSVAPVAPVRPGIDVLLSGDMAALKGMRVGLITNHTGKTLDGRSTIDALYGDKRLKLVALFAPEHGIRGSVNAGDKIGDETDTKTGLPIHSLYGKTNRPTPEMLAELDALVFDIQDIGSRYYTYPWTMTLALRAAAENHKRFVVLDRPVPIGGDLVQGNVNDTLTFVGLEHVPMRHGMTVGELATMVNKKFNLGADLVVIKAENWKRTQWYESTSMPWIAPSPNMQSIEAAAHYPGTCLFEATNLSVGRGTAIAYQHIGAPWLNAEALIKRFDKYQVPGVRMMADTFTPIKPGDGKYADKQVQGVRFIVTDRATYDPTHAALVALVEIHRLHPDEMQITPGFARLVGNSRVRGQILQGMSYQMIVNDWDAQAVDFRRARREWLLY